jgi:diaminohydroxyphosphoribosylaminopyrimidine deaminase/5-amino-6-(5-phosphoribosylamino)uracil reductase
MVGALVVRDGEIVGRGFHRRVGGAHAEVEALRRAGARAAGATLYVTLEPCAHHGRTPPCVDAVLAAGVARVVACHADPDPRVGGRGFARLRAAGVAVESGALAAEAARLNLRYLAAAALGRPAVTLKWAMSLDGKISTATGDSRWISSPPARAWALRLREEHDALLVGSGTLLADDPRLDRRLGLADAPNLRAVLDRRLRVEPAARLFAVPGPVVVYTESADAARAAALAAVGAEVVRLPRVEPLQVLADLGARGARSVLVEGGGAVHAAFAESGAWERLEVVCAPLLLGGATAPGPLRGEGFPTLNGAPGVEGLEVRRLGPDVLLSGIRAGLLARLEAAVREFPA